MFDSFKKIYYSGKMDDIVRIPAKCKEHISDRYAAIMYACQGKSGWTKDKNGMVPVHYFGMYPVADKSQSKGSYGTYTASETYSGSGEYSVSEDTYFSTEAYALKIYVEAPFEVAIDPKSNVNRWLKAISWPPRGFWFWVLSLVLSVFLVGIPLLVGCIYRFVQSIIAKKCLKKAKARYKLKGHVEVF